MPRPIVQIILRDEVSAQSGTIKRSLEQVKRSLEQVKRSLEQVKRSCNIKAFASAASAASVRLMAASRRTTEAPPWPSSRRGRISERPYGCRPRPLVLWFAYILSGTMRLEQVDANKRCASN